MMSLLCQFELKCWSIFEVPQALILGYMLLRLFIASSVASDVWKVAYFSQIVIVSLTAGEWNAWKLMVSKLLVLYPEFSQICLLLLQFLWCVSTF